jgi:uncharacterized cysteine cluster protein YcgN (CxxCxxCC family)
MNKGKKLTVNELYERWEWLKFGCGIEELLVTERLHNGTEKIYIVSGLAMELEQQFVICTDYNDVLFDSDCILRMFLQNNLKTITLFPYKGWFKEELVFLNRTIYIEKVS